MDLESRVAVLEEQTRTLAEGLARIEGKLDLLAVSVSGHTLPRFCCRPTLQTR